MRRLACLAAALLTLPLAAAAQDEGKAAPDPVAQLKGCIADKVEAGDEPRPCVNEVQAECLDLPAEAPSVAAKCFLERKETWGAALSETMKGLQKGLSEDAAAMAGIEMKYALMGNLMQCDRLEELRLVREDPSEATRAVDARCEATATGMALADLLARMQAAQ